jgi:hypothetical protein
VRVPAFWARCDRRAVPLTSDGDQTILVIEARGLPSASRWEGDELVLTSVDTGVGGRKPKGPDTERYPKFWN